MKLPTAIAMFLLPYIALAAYDESSTRKIKLEDIEDEHLQNERKPKAYDPQSMPPPLNKQPAKGQPVKLHPSASDQSKPSTAVTSNHHYTTRAEQHVQPLTDQPNSPPQADYQQSPTYQRETIVYVSSDADQRPAQQPSPPFYYSHDGDAANQQRFGNGYQLQFVPLDGSNEEHDSQQEEIAQKQESAQYLPPKENEIQPVHGLTAAGAFYESAGDIRYATPAATYGVPTAPQQQYSNDNAAIEYSQQASYASEQKNVDYPSLGYNQPLQNYGSQSLYYAPHTVPQVPQIQYGAPDAPFRRPKSQSNQSVYAPRRPEQAARSNEDLFGVSFPYPPSFVSITTERPLYEKAVPAPVPNEAPQWPANIMSLHVVPAQDIQYQLPPSAASPVVNQHLQHLQHLHLQSGPMIDIFNSRQAKSLLDSYIPSWLVFRVQEEHARRFHQQQLQQPKQAYAIPSASAEEPAYNTLSYSTQYDPAYGNNHKRSVHRPSESLLKNKTIATTKKAA